MKEFIKRLLISLLVAVVSGGSIMLLAWAANGNMFLGKWIGLYVGLSAGFITFGNFVLSKRLNREINFNEYFPESGQKDQKRRVSK